MKNEKRNKKKRHNLEELDVSTQAELNMLDVEESDRKAVNQFYQGARVLKDYVAPPAFNRGDETYMQVGTKFMRSMTLQGYPKEVEVGWLDEMYDYDGDMDTAVYIELTDDRVALDEFTDKIAQYEAELIMERQKGSVKKITALDVKLRELYQERAMIEQNAQNIFQVCISTNLYTDDLKDLKQRTEKLDNKLKGRKLYHAVNVLRQDEGYKTALPFGKNYIPDTYRNLNTGAVVACFPFINAQIMHPQGVYMGRNISTGSPIFIDLFNRDFVFNSNATIFGEAGSGKTVTASTFIFRNVLRGCRITSIDPENEYSNLAESLGGVNIDIAPDSQHFINPFDLEEEDEIDQSNNVTGRKIVDVKGKVADVLNLIGVMSKELDGELRSIVSFTIAELYAERGMTEEVSSLYIEDTLYNEETNEFYYAEIKKPMPTFSDFHTKLMEKAMRESNPRLQELCNSLLIFKKGGLYDMFDCETSDSLKHYQDAPMINFNVSRLEESVLRPIGMFISLSYAWERFGKKTPGQKKFIVCDESWMLTSKHMAGYEYTSAMLEKLARRFRKRTGGLLCISQNFQEFTSSDEGRAVLANSALNMFLKTKHRDLNEMQTIFQLSDGERQFLLQARRGEVLIKTATETAIMKTHVLESEKSLLLDKKPKQFHPKE